MSATAPERSCVERDLEREARTCEEVLERYIAHHGRRPKGGEVQVNGMAALLIWCRAAIVLGRDPDTEILRSIPQIVEAIGPRLGWDIAPTKRRNKELYSTRIRNWFDYLIELGYFESREPVLKTTREGRGILVRLPAGVAQSVRAAES